MWTRPFNRPNSKPKGDSSTTGALRDDSRVCIPAAGNFLANVDGQRQEVAAPVPKDDQAKNRVLNAEIGPYDIICGRNSDAFNNVGTLSVTASSCMPKTATRTVSWRT